MEENGEGEGTRLTVNVKSNRDLHPTLSLLPYKYAEGVLYGEGGRKFEFCVCVK